ncbi:MAG: YIP1 family protein [Paracoccaceae bacterium]
MLRTIVDSMIMSYRAPRAAVRQVIDAVNGWEAVALIFGVAFCLNTIVALLLAVAAGQTGAGLGFLLSNLSFSAVAYAVVVLLVHRVGRLFGGVGSLIEIATTIAWHSLVTVIFAPLVAAATLPGLMESAMGFLAVAQIVMVGVVLWLLANFVAEAHRFASAWRVAIGLFGGVFVIAFVLSLLLPNLISAS